MNETSQGLMVRMAQRYGMTWQAFEATMMATIIPKGKATREQVAAFLLVAERYHLDPFLREIYAFPDRDGGVRPIVGVDGWIKLIVTHPQFGGIRFDDIERDGRLVATTCTIRRKDCPDPIVITEYLAECQRPTPTWSQMPRRSLRHKALMQCGRVAFGFSGISDPEEGAEAAEMERPLPQPSVQAPPKDLDALAEQLAGTVEDPEVSAAALAADEMDDDPFRPLPEYEADLPADPFPRKKRSKSEQKEML